jgi:hypothetical protein
MPIVLSGFVLVLLLIKLVMIYKLPYISQRLGLQKFGISQKLTSLMSFMVVGFYTLLISTVVQPFNCTKQLDGTFTLTKAPSLKCFDASWNKHLPAISFFLILYGFSIPLVMIWIFYKNRKQIFTVSFRSRYHSLTSPYKTRYFYFEIVFMLKRALFVLSNDFLSATSYTVRYFTGVGTLLFFFWIDILLLPYQNKNFNLLSCS